MADDYVYRDGDIVWVKWNGHWWPGEVTGIERQPEGLIKQLKRKPYCVVKFFNEDTYECIHSPKKILPYECMKKEEFIRKGYSLLNNKNKYMEKFPADIEIAEQLICHKNHVTINNRPDSIVKVILGQPLVRDTNSQLSFNSSKNVHYNATRRDSIMQILDLTPKCEFHEIDCSKTTTNNGQGTAATINSEPPASRGVREGDFYQCNFCDFTSFRQNVMILHRKMHNDKSMVKIPVSTTSTTFNIVTKSVDVVSQLNETNHIKDKQLRNQYTDDFTIIDADSVNNELQHSEKFEINKRRESNKNNENVEEIHTSHLQGSVQKKNGTINLSTPPKSSELRQSVTTCRLPKKKELASLALREKNKEVMDAEDNIDKEIYSQTQTDKSVNVMPKVLPPEDMPKRVGEEIRKILADWSDEEDITIESELKSKEEPQNVQKVAFLSNLPNGSLPSTSIASSNTTVHTKTSGRIRNIPKKDRRDVVLQDFNSDLNECTANTENLKQQMIDLPNANVDNFSNASNSSLVEIVEDENYSAVIVIPDDENYANDENVRNKQNSIEQLIDKTIISSNIHEKEVKKSNHLIKSSIVSCFDFREEDMIEEKMESNASAARKVLTDSELAKEVEQLLEQTVISISKVKSTISSNAKHAVSENLLRSEETEVHVKDLPIKERSKRIFKSRNLTHIADLSVKESSNVVPKNAIMIIDKKQNTSQPDTAKLKLIENVPADFPRNNLIPTSEQAHETHMNTNTSSDGNFKNEGNHLLPETQRDHNNAQFPDINEEIIDKTQIVSRDNTEPAYVNDNQTRQPCLLISELQDPLIVETPIDENSSLAASDTGAEFGSPTSMLDEQRISPFEHNIEANICINAAKKIHKSSENIYNKVDSEEANAIGDTFAKQSAPAVSTMGDKPVTYKNNFLKHKDYNKQKSTSHITRRITLEKVDNLYTISLPTKENLKKKAVSLTSLNECNNIEQSPFKFYYRSLFFKKQSKCLPDTDNQSVEDDKKQNILDIVKDNLITVSSVNVQTNFENANIEAKVTHLSNRNLEVNILGTVCTAYQQMEEIFTENCKNITDRKEEKTNELEKNEKANKIDKCGHVPCSNEMLTIPALVHDTNETNVESSSNKDDKELIKDEKNCNEYSLVELTVSKSNLCLGKNFNNSNVLKRKILNDNPIAGYVDFECTTNKEDDIKNSKMGKKPKQSCNLDLKISNIKTPLVIEKKNNTQSIKKDLKFKENNARHNVSPTLASLTFNNKADGLTVITKQMDPQIENACPEVSANSTSTSTLNNVECTTKIKQANKLITDTALIIPSCQKIKNTDELQNESVKCGSIEIPVNVATDTERMIQNTDSSPKIGTTSKSDPLVNDQELLDMKILQTDTSTQLDDEFLIEFDSIVNNQEHNCKQSIKEIPSSKCKLTRIPEVLEETQLLPLCSESTLNSEINCTLKILQPNNYKNGKMGNKRRKTICGDTCGNQEIMYKITRHNHRKRKISADVNSDSLFTDRVKSCQQATLTSKILELSPSKKLNWKPNHSTRSPELSSTNNLTTNFVSSNGEIFDLPSTILELDNEELLPDLTETVGISIKVSQAENDSMDNQSQPNAVKILGQQIIPPPCLITNSNTMQLKQNLSEKEHKPSAKAVGGINSTISNKNKQIGTDSRGNKYVIIKTPAHNLKVHPAPIKTSPTVKAKISKNLTSNANNIVIFPRDDCINVLSPQKEKNTLIDNAAFQLQRRTSLVTKPKNECNKELTSALHKNLSCEATSLNKIPVTSVVNIHHQLNSDKSSFSVASEVSFKAQQQLLQLQQQHAEQQVSVDTIKENPINQPQRKSRKFSQNKVSGKSLKFEQKESQHQQLIHEDITQNSLGDFSKKNSANQDAMQIEESIDQTSKILAVPTQPIPGYNETFLLCTLVDNIYKPIDNVPLYLNHDLNQLVPVPLEIITDEPRLIVNQPICPNSGHLSPQKKPEVSILNNEIVSRSNETEDDSNENVSVEVEGPLIVLPPNFIEETIIDENSSEIQPINDGQLTILESNEDNHTLVPSNAIILNIEGQQVILDANTFAHLLANPDANTQLITDGGTEFILTREVLAALQIQHDVQTVAHEQQQHSQEISLEENSHNLLTVDLQEPNLYNADALEIDTSQNLQLISTDGNISFQPTISLTPHHLTPPIQANVNETNALLDQTPIMSISESPSNASIYRKTKVASLLASGGVLTDSEAIDSFCNNLHPNLEDSLAAIGVTTQSSTVPPSLDLPITVTNPNIAPKVNAAPPIDMVQYAPPRSVSAAATVAGVAAADFVNESQLFNDTAS